MENIEKPLTWVLVIVLLGYLFATNIGSENDSSFTIKDLKMGSVEIIDTPAGEKKCVKIEDDSLNVDSIVDAVLADIDMKGNIDTLIEIRKRNYRVIKLLFIKQSRTHSLEWVFYFLNFPCTNATTNSIAATKTDSLPI